MGWAKNGRRVLTSTELLKEVAGANAAYVPAAETA